MLGLLSLDSWNDVSVWFLAIGAFSTAVVVVSTFAVIKLTREEAVADKKALELYKAGVAIEVGKANAVAENAKAEAARANARAAEADLARIKLEEKFAWRSLDDGRQARMIKALRPFAGQKFLSGVSDNAEANNFLKIVESVLEKAGWLKLPVNKESKNTLVIYDEELEAVIESRQGVIICYSSEKKNEFAPLVFAFLKAFNDEGIYAVAEENVKRAILSDEILIIVGSKPYRNDLSESSKQ